MWSFPSERTSPLNSQLHPVPFSLLHLVVPGLQSSQTAPWLPLGPGGPGNDLLVPGFPCSPAKYNTQTLNLVLLHHLSAQNWNCHKTFLSYGILTITNYAYSY